MGFLRKNGKIGMKAVLPKGDAGAMVETYVSFRCDNPAVSRLYEEAERKARLNLRSFGGETVLVEGGGYNKIWLETQPMGGEMYALRNLEAARNNTLLFMKH